MELTIDERVLNQYGLAKNNVKIQQIGSGHINRTYLLTNLVNNSKYILQSINASVFTQPEVIASNVRHVAAYLKNQFKDYLFPAPIESVEGKPMVKIADQYWRISPFIDNSVALDTLSSPKQAYEAAKQFAKLSRLLDGFDASKLAPAIVGFHDLNLRYRQFNLSLKNTEQALLEKAASQINAATRHRDILSQFLIFNKRDDFPDRVMHHDTKISNVLLDESTFEGICVIDLDTLMPGKFISDLGDMMRTYLCEFSENETDLSKITIRIPYFTAMVDGYLSEMGDILTDTEKEAILFSGKYIIYMQALRFLTDYLNGSTYYPIQYSEQNLDRANNQFKLLEELINKENQLQEIVDICLNKKQTVE
jgi:Ser/Thr protein kinase RdoA (MazF antagonist)